MKLELVADDGHLEFLVNGENIAKSLSRIKLDARADENGGKLAVDFEMRLQRKNRQSENAEAVDGSVKTSD